MEFVSFHVLSHENIKKWAEYIRVYRSSIRAATQFPICSAPYRHLSNYDA